MLQPTLSGGLPAPQPSPIYTDSYTYAAYSDPYMTTAEMPRPNPYYPGMEYAAYAPRVMGLYHGTNNFGYHGFGSQWL